MNPEIIDSYRQNMRQMMADIIADYLATDELTPDDLVNDFRAEIKSWMDYHRQQEMKASQMYCKTVGLTNSKL